jgi:hypothetical protein
VAFFSSEAFIARENSGNSEEEDEKLFLFSKGPLPSLVVEGTRSF